MSDTQPSAPAGPTISHRPLTPRPNYLKRLLLVPVRVAAWFNVPAHRALAYRVLTIVGPVAVAAGYLSQDELAEVLGFASTILSSAGHFDGAVHNPKKREN